MSKYAVTGCAGFIGSHLTESLLSEGNTVLGIDCLRDYYPLSWKLHNLGYLEKYGNAFQFHDLDLADAPLSDCLEGVEGVFHLAAQAGVRDSWGDGFSQYLHDNVLATQRLMEITASRCRLIFASSSSVYGRSTHFPQIEDQPLNPRSPYGVTKLTCEHLAASYEANFGLDYVGLRYFTVYGPRQRPDMAFTRVAKCLLDGKAFKINGDGLQRRDVTYVLDVVEATIAAMNAPISGCVLNVGGGMDHSLNEYIELFEEAAHTSLNKLHAPTAVGDVDRTRADCTNVREALNWVANTDPATGVAAHFAWAEQNRDLLST